MYYILEKRFSECTVQLPLRTESIILWIKFRSQESSIYTHVLTVLEICKKTRGYALLSPREETDFLQDTHPFKIWFWNRIHLPLKFYLSGRTFCSRVSIPGCACIRISDLSILRIRSQWSAVCPRLYPTRISNNSASFVYKHKKNINPLALTTYSKRSAVV